MNLLDRLKESETAETVAKARDYSAARATYWRLACAAARGEEATDADAQELERVLAELEQAPEAVADLAPGEVPFGTVRMIATRKTRADFKADVGALRLLADLRRDFIVADAELALRDAHAAHNAAVTEAAGMRLRADELAQEGQVAVSRAQAVLAEAKSRSRQADQLRNELRNRGLDDAALEPLVALPPAPVVRWVRAKEKCSVIDAGGNIGLRIPPEIMDYATPQGRCGVFRYSGEPLPHLQELTDAEAAAYFASVEEEKRQRREGRRPAPWIDNRDPDAVAAARQRREEARQRAAALDEAGGIERAVVASFEPAPAVASAPAKQPPKGNATAEEELDALLGGEENEQ